MPEDQDMDDVIDDLDDDPIPAKRDTRIFQRKKRDDDNGADKDADKDEDFEEDVFV